jgi:hypothetical protein
MHTAAGVDNNYLFIADDAARSLQLNRLLVAKSVCFLIMTFAAITSIASSEPSGQSTPPRIENRLVAYDLSKLPVSALKLSLTGTITGTSRSALISVAGRAEESVAVGQFITGNVLLVDVDQKYAVIYREGLYEKLELRGGTESDIAIPEATDSIPPSFSETDTSESKAQIDPGLNTPGQESGASKKLSYMGMRFDSSDLLSQAKITPGPEGGMDITETTSGGIYERLGLEAGDTIQTINEESVNSFYDLVTLSQHSGNSNKVVARIMRSGNLYRMQFDPVHGIEVDMIVSPEK